MAKGRQPSEGNQKAPYERRASGDPADYPEIMTTAQVADMLGINLQTVQRLAKPGRIPAHRLPGTRRGEYRFFKSEVLDWLRSQTHELPEDVEEKPAPRKKAAARRKTTVRGRTAGR